MSTRQEIIEKVNGLIESINVAMLTTIDETGTLHSRPMVTQKQQFDGDVWFFAERSSDKVREIERNSTVNVAYGGDNRFVSLAGDARIVSDISKKRDLWHDSLEVWFEQGPESPEVVLIHVDAKSAQYWDMPRAGVVGQAISMVRVMLSGDNDSAGDSDKVTF